MNNGYRIVCRLFYRERYDTARIAKLQNLHESKVCKILADHGAKYLQLDPIAEKRSRPQQSNIRGRVV